MINLGSDIFFGQCYDAFWRKYLKKLGLALIRATRIGHFKKIQVVYFGMNNWIALAFCSNSGRPKNETKQSFWLKKVVSLGSWNVKS